MKNQKIIRTLLMMLLVVCLLFGYPTVANAAGIGIGDSVSGFLSQVLHFLVTICDGIIGLFGMLLNLIEDLIMWIVGLFT